MTVYPEDLKGCRWSGGYIWTRDSIELVEKGYDHPHSICYV